MSYFFHHFSLVLLYIFRWKNLNKNSMIRYWVSGVSETNLECLFFKYNTFFLFRTIRMKEMKDWEIVSKKKMSIQKRSCFHFSPNKTKFFAFFFSFYLCSSCWDNIRCSMMFSYEEGSFEILIAWSIFSNCNRNWRKLGWNATAISCVCLFVVCWDCVLPRPHW